MSILLPGSRAALVTPDGLTTQAFYRWFQALNGSSNSGELADDQLAEAIREIATALGSPDGSVENIPPQGGSFVLNGSPSIKVTGTPASGLVRLDLFDTGVTEGTYGDETHIPVLSINAKGQVTVSSTVAIGAAGGEILVADGISGPPVMLTNEDEDDFLYQG